MAINEQDRHRLQQRLDEVLGPVEAGTLMSHLPPVGWQDVATRQQLDALGERMDTRFAAVDARFEARFDAVNDRMDARFEVSDSKVDVLRHEVGEQIAVAFRDQTRFLVFTFIACTVSFASMVIAAVKL